MIREILPSVYALSLVGVSGLLSGCLPWWTTPAQYSVDVAIMLAEERKFDEVTEDFGKKVEIVKELTTNGFLWIRADVYQSEVLLTGTVKTDEDEKQAVELVKAVDGVTKVYDEIQVSEEGTIEGSAQDFTTEYRIQLALLRQIQNRIINYRWRCVNGTAYMIGMAKDDEELDEALDAVLGTDGVVEIVHHIRIKPLDIIEKIMPKKMKSDK